MALTLLAFFMVVWLAFIGLGYFAALAIEALWGSGISLLAFLIIFFGSIIVAWLTAVKLTEPKAAGGHTR